MGAKLAIRQKQISRPWRLRKLGKKTLSTQIHILMGGMEGSLSQSCPLADTCGLADLLIPQEAEYVQDGTQEE